MLTAALLSLALTPWTPAPPLQTASEDDRRIRAGGWEIAVDEEVPLGLGVVITGPGGTVRRRVLSRDLFVSDAEMGIDASGNALVAWRVKGRLRTARGPELTRGPDLPEALAVDVAVSAGHTLLAWSTLEDDVEGVYAQVDGGAPVRLAESTPWELSAAINDAGAAMVAYHGYDLDPVTVSDRAPDGPWSAPHDVSGGHAVAYVDAPVPPTLSSAISTDGRVALTWNSRRRGAGRVFAVTGRAGGAWDPARQLSSPVFAAVDERAALDSAGDPHVSWDEEGLKRGAKPVAGAAADPSPLTVAAELPGPLPRVRGGSVTVTARVRCSKPCAAQLRAPQGFDRPQDLPADTDTTLRMRLYDPRIMAPRHSGRLRAEVVVTDRAGHVERRARTFRLRVVRPPLRSFGVGPSHSFAMFTRAGDRAVGRLVNAVIDGLASGEITTLRELRRRWRAGAAALDRAGHDEHEETACREEIGRALSEPLALKGYDVEAVIL